MTRLRQGSGAPRPSGPQVEAPRRFFCSFCGADSTQVEQMLVAAVSTAICSECVVAGLIQIETIHGPDLIRSARLRHAASTGARSRLMAAEDIFPLPVTDPETAHG